MDPFVAQGVQKMAPGSFGGHSSIITPLHLTPQTVRKKAAGTPPAPTCAVEFFPVTTTRGISLGSITSTPIVDGLYIYQGKVVSGASVIRRWDWDTFDNETTAYTPTQQQIGTLLLIGVRAITADASNLYWIEFEQTTDGTDNYFQQRVMKSDHSFTSPTVFSAHTTVMPSGFDPYLYSKLVRSPTNGDLVLAYTFVDTGITHYRFDTIDSSSASRVNIRDSTTALFVGNPWMTYTPNGLLWGQDASGDYWKMSSGTFTNLGNPFGSDDGFYLVPTPSNTILTARFDGTTGNYVEQYEMDSSGNVTVASCDYQTIMSDPRSFIGWNPDVSVIGFGGIIDGGSSGTPADHHFYRWG